MNVPGKDDKQRDIMQLVRDFLSEYSERPWFMVLDNADDSDIWLKPGGSAQRSTKALIEYLPRSSHGECIWI